MELIRCLTSHVSRLTSHVSRLLGAILLCHMVVQAGINPWHRFYDVTTAWGDSAKAIDILISVDEPIDTNISFRGVSKADCPPRYSKNPTISDECRLYLIGATSKELAFGIHQISNGKHYLGNVFIDLSGKYLLEADIRFKMKVDSGSTMTANVDFPDSWNRFGFGSNIYYQNWTVDSTGPYWYFVPEINLRGVMVHEFGHYFYGLVDEYYPSASENAKFDYDQNPQAANWLQRCKASKATIPFSSLCRIKEKWTSCFKSLECYHEYVADYKAFKTDLGQYPVMSLMRGDGYIATPNRSSWTIPSLRNKLTDSMGAFSLSLSEAENKITQWQRYNYNLSTPCNAYKNSPTDTHNAQNIPKSFTISDSLKQPRSLFFS